MTKYQSLKISCLLVFVLTIISGIQKSNASIPRPDHIVICVLENHGYSQVIGCPSAPYINHLSSIGANMVEYYALSHPSQPNYIMLFSGSNQGVTNDNLPVGTPWSTPNLGASLINSGFTFTGYSEDLPAIGSLVGASGSYGRKHSPWINWQGNGTNQIPTSINLTMDHFPSDFTNLPTVSFVIPNMDNDMHNGVDPARIISGDAWVNTNLSAYVNWAMMNNSLLVVLFDEDDNLSSNHIPCIFVGPMIQSGQYSTNGYNHYNLLRTIEDMYGLPYAGNSANARPVEEIFLTNKVQDITRSLQTSFIYPNPIIDQGVINLENIEESTTKTYLEVYDNLGTKKKEEIVSFGNTKSIPFKRDGLSSGIYFYRILSDKKEITTGKFIID